MEWLKSLIETLRGSMAQLLHWVEALAESPNGSALPLLFCRSEDFGSLEEGRGRQLGYPPIEVETA